MPFTKASAAAPKPPPTKRVADYPLIQSFASAHIRKEGRSWFYKLEEPTLSPAQQAMLDAAKSHIIDVMDSDRTLKEGDIELYLRNSFRDYKRKYNAKLAEADEQLVWYYLMRDFVGLGRIEPLMRDANIEDISCDGIGVPIYISHKEFGPLKTSRQFSDEKELEDFVIKLSQKCGRFISYGEPLLDGSLSDGSRVQATFGAGVTIRGPTFDIRKFREIPFTPLDLFHMGTFSLDELAYLWIAIEKRKNVLISGGTASGKSTALNAISLFIPENLKIVSIEDTAELNLLHENWVQSVSRSGLASAGTQKYGEVSMFDLLKASFRQRPDYVIVGEVRGKEATVMFQGMASGHAGMGTIHAESLAAVVDRLSTPPISLPRSLIGILDILVVQINAPQIRENARRCKEIVEVSESDEKISSKAIFKWDAHGDKTMYFGSSRILVEEGGESLEPEMKKRVQFLELLDKKGVSFKEFPAWVHVYQDDSNKAFKLLSMT